MSTESRKDVSPSSDEGEDRNEEGKQRETPSQEKANGSTPDSKTTQGRKEEAKECTTHSQEDDRTQPKSGEDAEIDELAQKVQKIHLDEMPPTLVKVAQWIQNGTCRKILVLSGAGVSVAAGIPDFRSPGTGLYDNLQAYHLPYPEAVFDLRFYRRNPRPFCSLAKDIWPGRQRYAPTLTHSFVALLAEHDLLLRNYTQNIDGLEFLAGIPDEKLVECHGHFRTASCVSGLCGRKADVQDAQESIFAGSIPVCRHCRSLVKPDIVFFGEGLPDRFHRLLPQDLVAADCCLILGTSLNVAPFSRIPDKVQGSCKRILLNRELVGNLDLDNDRDVFYGGDCDDSVLLLARLLGWEQELAAILHKQQKQQQQQQQQQQKDETAEKEGRAEEEQASIQHKQRRPQQQCTLS